MKKSVVIVDTNNLLYRMFYTQPPRISKGHRIESMMASANIFRQLSVSTPIGKPECVISVFDPDGPTFRNSLYSDYKAERKGMPEELRTQEDGLKQVLRAMGVPVIDKPGFEADDAIGMLTSHYLSMGMRVLIYANDKDIFQLVNEDVSVLNPSGMKIIDVPGVIEKMGIPPSLIPDLLAIKGDRADNIIGVDGVGDKTAAKLLGAYGSLRNLIAHSSEIPGKTGQRIAAFEQQAEINLALSTIVTDKLLLNESELAEITRREGDVKKCQHLKSIYGVDVKPLTAEITPSTHNEPAAKKEKPQKSDVEQMSLF